MDKSPNFTQISDCTSSQQHSPISSGNNQYPPPYSDTIVSQPQAVDGSGEWMNIPLGVPGRCPPGLEYLISTDELLVKQTVEQGWCKKDKKFMVENKTSQKVYWAEEEITCCDDRPLIKLVDSRGNEVIQLYRPTPNFFSCPWCTESVEISSPIGSVFARVEQECTWCYPSFTIKSPNGDTILRLEGGILYTGPFKVLTANGVQIGEISVLAKRWFGNSDFFRVKFPLDLDIRMKASLLGAGFLMATIVSKRRRK